MAPSLPSLPRANALRFALLAAAAAGVICLLLATFATVIEIKVGTTTKVPDHDTHLSGWDRHGPALLVIAAFAAAMVVGAARGARPAMAALAVLGLVALLIAVVGDVPDLDETGFIGQVYEDAAAGRQGRLLPRDPRRGAAARQRRADAGRCPRRAPRPIAAAPGSAAEAEA